MIVETKNGTEEVKTAEEMKQEIDVQEGKVVDHVELRCDRHGDITKGAIFLSYATKTTDEEVIQHQNFFCIQCLAELLDKFKQNGEVGNLQMIKHLRDETEEEKAARLAQTEETPKETE